MRDRVKRIMKYVAQVAMGASQAQYFKAIKEAEASVSPTKFLHPE